MTDAGDGDETGCGGEGAKTHKETLQNHFVLYFSPRKGTLTDAEDGGGAFLNKKEIVNIFKKKMLH